MPEAQAALAPADCSRRRPLVRPSSAPARAADRQGQECASSSGPRWCRHTSTGAAAALCARVPGGRCRPSSAQSTWWRTKGKALPKPSLLRWNFALESLKEPLADFAATHFETVCPVNCFIVPVLPHIMLEILTKVAGGCPRVTMARPPETRILRVHLRARLTVSPRDESIVYIGVYWYALFHSRVASGLNFRRFSAGRTQSRIGRQDRRRPRKSACNLPVASS